jgi:hypothetical protein
MRRILFSFIVILFSCNSNKNAKNQTETETTLLQVNNKAEFSLIDYKSEFKLVINEYYVNKQAVGHAVGYNLYIGETTTSLLPKKLTVLSFSQENEDINIGDTIRFLPNVKQYVEGNEYPLIYYAKDTIINGKMDTHILGSDNKAIWANPILD